MAKRTGYVIVEIGWEYNDEYYYRPDSGGGTPKKFFTDKAKAEVVCHDMNKAAKDKGHAIENQVWDEEKDEYVDKIEDTYEVMEVEID
jgi:hypothetical protein